MTRFVVVSDTHNLQEKLVLPKGDVLIHCGDMTNRGTLIEFQLVMSYFNGVCDDFDHIIIVAGNHDFGLADPLLKQTILELAPENLTYLEDSGVTYQGINIYGTPWMNKFYDWAFMTDEEELGRIYSGIPARTNLLITHAPPWSILDVNPRGENCGSKALYSQVKLLPDLKAHVFGHIHLQGGKKEIIDTTTFYNCAVTDERYNVSNNIQVFDL